MSYRVSAALKNSENYKRYMKIHKRFFTLWLLIFLISVIFPFTQFDLISRAMFGFGLGAFIAIPCLAIAGYHLIPSQCFPRRRSKKSLSPFDEDMYTRYEENNSQWYERNDWYNDVTNPASPIYQVTHNTHRDY